MPREDTKLAAAKRSYHSANSEGNRQEEARWANVIGDILKNRGEYVEALKWFRIDHDISSKYLPEKHLLPTCQSLGEAFLRLELFSDALIYQKKHLELAKNLNDLIEQQRASTQLGRTYHEMFTKTDDDYSIRNAKKYFRSAMDLAKVLKESPPDKRSSFLKEYIDAHNNIGMLELELDNFEEAEKVLMEGLKICDEEEVAEDDDGRTRLHHNLGNVYLSLRMWDKAKHHIERDIIICKNIGHLQGEAKGYINLGELHYKLQKYDDASLCYQKALKLAKSMQDEDALVEQIKGNINTLKEAIKVIDDLKSEEQNFKKLARNLASARGTPAERKCLLQLIKSLDCLIEKAAVISAWKKHLDFAKQKKNIAGELYDKEKQGDSYLAIGESYKMLRNFIKALKWYNKALQMHKSIGNMEGQVMAKIGIGDVLDNEGNWGAAFDAFEEGYRIAHEAGLSSLELSSLENMHYIHMIRFDNAEEAKRLQIIINDLKKCLEKKEAETVREDCCSETDTEGNDDVPIHKSAICSSQEKSTSNSHGTRHHNNVDELTDDSPLISSVRSNKSSSKKLNILKHTTASPENASKSYVRKRVRLVLSDDEDEANPTEGSSKGSPLECPAEGSVYRNKVAVNLEESTHSYRSSMSNKLSSQSGKRVRLVLSDDEDEIHPTKGSSKGSPFECPAEGSVHGNKVPVNLEESTCSYKSSISNKLSSQSGKQEISHSDEVVAYDVLSGGSKSNFNSLHNKTPRHLECQASDENYEKDVTFQLENEIVRIKIDSKQFAGKTNIEYVKAQLACSYYLQLPTETRAKGLLPIIQQLKIGGRVLECSDSEDAEGKDLQFGKGILQVSVGGWIQKPLIKLYIDFCKDLAETPNLKLLTNLYNLEVSEDEVIVSDCELQDVSITPLLNAMNVQGSFSLLNLSHNLLGNGTMEKLHQIFKSSGQNYGDLSLDLHSNRFGPTTLFQICQCPVLYDRLVMLNISGNRLTDACGSYLSTILKKCKALYSLNIENCSITSRTINKIADSLDSTSMLTQLYIGHNDSVSGVTIVNLLSKLVTMTQFSDLSLSGLKLSKPATESLCKLAKTLSLSGLMLGGTNIGTEGALQLSESLLGETQELVKLDLSRCGLSSHYFSNPNIKTPLFCGITELNIGGNTINQEGADLLAAVLSNPDCCIRVLSMNRCDLGLSGVLQIIQALSENNSLKELNLADNINPVRRTPGSINPKPDQPHNITCVLNREPDNLEVADSEDENMELDQSCASSCEKITPVSKCPFAEDLYTTIGFARRLEILDLSSNGLSVEAVESAYRGWTGYRASSAIRHVYGNTVHFSVRENRCCRAKPCCRRD